MSQRRKSVGFGPRPVPALGRTWAYRIVRASRRISPLAKLLYEILLELDNPNTQQGHPGGCYMTEVELARQLGASADHVSDLRTHLQRLGLVHREGVPGSRVTWWFPTLPPGIETVPPPGIESLPTKRRTESRRAWLAAQAEALDHAVMEREQTTNSPITRGRQRHRAERRIPPPVLPDETKHERRNPPPAGGGIRHRGEGDDGGVQDGERRNPPPVVADPSWFSPTSDSLEEGNQRGELLTESDTERSRSEASMTGTRPPLDSETAAIMEQFQRRRATIAGEQARVRP